MSNYNVIHPKMCIIIIIVMIIIIMIQWYAEATKQSRGEENNGDFLCTASL